MDYLDVQISLDGLDAATNDAVRGEGSYATGPPGDGQPGRRRLRAVQDLGRRHPPQRRPARRLRGAGRRLRRPAPGHPAAPVGPGRRHAGTSCTPRPSSSARSTAGCSPTATTCSPATPSSTSTPSASRCPASTSAAPAGWCASSTRSATCTPARSSSTTSSWPATSATPGGFAAVWRTSELFRSLREPQSAGACASCGSYDACQGGCMAAKFFTGLPLDGPDPECVNGHGERAAGRGRRAGAAPLPERRPLQARRRPGDVPASQGRLGRLSPGTRQALAALHLA